MLGVLRREARRCFRVAAAAVVVVVVALLNARKGHRRNRLRKLHLEQSIGVAGLSRERCGTATSIRGCWVVVDVVVVVVVIGAGRRRVLLKQDSLQLTDSAGIIV